MLCWRDIREKLCVGFWREGIWKWGNFGVSCGVGIILKGLDGLFFVGYGRERRKGEVIEEFWGGEKLILVVRRVDRNFGEVGLENDYELREF